MILHFATENISAGEWVKIDEFGYAHKATGKDRQEHEYYLWKKCFKPTFIQKFMNFVKKLKI